MTVELKQAMRGLWHSRRFTITAVAVLALGIAANTAIFTVIEAAMLRPLAFDNSDRVVSIGRPGGGTASIPMFVFWERNNPELEDLSAYLPGSSLNLDGGDRPELVSAVRVSRTYFHLFGAHPILGRTFLPEEDRPGGPRVMVMSYGMWQTRFGGDPTVVGRPVTLGGAACTIVGVLSPRAAPYPASDLWLPLQADPESSDAAHVLHVLARVPRGMTPATASARMAVIGKQYARNLAARLIVGKDDQLEVAPIERQITGSIKPTLMILVGAVALVLLIACANVANLLLARGMARQREIAIRSALGASRGRIIRQLLIESLLIAIGGGGAGLTTGAWGVRLLLRIVPGDLPAMQQAAFNGSAAIFAILLALATALVFGLLPALQTARLDLWSPLKRRHNRTRDLLVAVEVAMAVVLVCGALLLIRSFAALQAVRSGIDPRNLLTAEISLAGPGYGSAGAVDRIQREFVERARRIPGVESAAWASELPLFGAQDMLFSIPGKRIGEVSGERGDVQWRIVSPDYFAVLRIRLAAGRFFDAGERGRTVVISESMARKYWRNESPVGQSIVVGSGLGPEYDAGATEVIGVAADVKERLDLEPAPVMYQLPSQVKDGGMALVNRLNPAAILVRTRPGVPSMSIGPAVRDALRMEGLAAGKVRPMEKVRLDSTSRRNFNLLLLGLFAAMAVLLAATGIYSVMSYNVEQRTHEIGIRTALGASRRDTLRFVVAQALRMALAGAGIGVAASFWLTRLLRSQLFHVKQTDSITFVCAPAMLALVALAAAFVPAWRATKVDAMAALRQQ